MKEELSEMALEELWELFPIFPVKPDDKWEDFNNEDLSHKNFVST